MHNFVMIVENEVVGNVTFPDQLNSPIDTDKYVAIYSSNPIFIPHHEGRIPEGYIWDGQNFNPPVE
jgi:hypothetical protein